MAIKVFVEFQIKPGRRDEFTSLVRGMMASMGSLPGFLGSTMYEVVGDPNGLAEIAEWESPEKERRTTMLERAVEGAAR